MPVYPFGITPPPELPNLGSDLIRPRGAEPESEIHGPVAGRYDLGERIAKGGMGIVYRAQDRLLNRTIAIKIIRTRFLDRPDLLRRFLAEARINARLQHPGVIPVYEVGSLPDSRPFIAMKLIEGRTLARLLSERQDPSDDLPHLLKVFEDVCQTVAYAHRQGVIHRDLKPENVMVGEYGEVLVMDWGLAKFLDPGAALAPSPDGFEAVERSAYLAGEGTTAAGENQTEVTAVQAVGPETPAGYTTAGEVFGTLPYMPPEQARGEADRMDRRGDVFSLGAILCQILTGQPPYFGPAEKLRENARAGKLFGAYILLDRCGADPALVALAKQCLVANPEGRPADAGVLAALVTQCVDGLQNRTRAIEVKRATAEARLAEAEAREQLVRRARRLSGLLAVAGVLVAALLVTGLGWHAKDRAAREMDENRRRAVVMRQIDEALAEAEAMDDRARNLDASADVRDGIAKQAVSAVQRAEALVAATPNPSVEVSERLAALKARVTETELGTRLTVALDWWRGWMFDASGKRNSWAGRDTEMVLGELGIDVSRGRKPEVIAAELKTHAAASSIRAWLIDGLAVEEDDPGIRKHYYDILRHAWGEPSRAWRAIHAIESADVEILLTPDADVPASWLIVASRRLIDAKRMDAAERLLAHGVRRFPADFTLNAMYGSLLRQKPGAQADAVRYLTAARTIRSGNIIVQQELGLALADTGRTDEALDVLRSAVQTAPTWVDGHVRIGKLLEQRGDEAAIDEFTVVVRLQPESAEFRAKLGAALLRFGRFREAATAFREAGDQLPADGPRREAIDSEARFAMKFAVLSDRLPNVLAGNLTPGTSEGWGDYGEAARQAKRYAAAAKCFTAAAAGDKRYAGSAAVCAALAGFGRGTDTAELTAEAKAVLRRQALASFRKSPGSRTDPALDPLKDRSQWSDLAPEERVAWRALWAGE